LNNYKQQCAQLLLNTITIHDVLRAVEIYIYESYISAAYVQVIQGIITDAVQSFFNISTVVNIQQN